jgi:hypothetical protein
LVGLLAFPTPQLYNIIKKHNDIGRHLNTIHDHISNRQPFDSTGIRKILNDKNILHEYHDGMNDLTHLYDGMRKLYPSIFSTPMVTGSNSGFLNILQVLQDYDNEHVKHSIIAIVHVGMLNELYKIYNAPNYIYRLKAIIFFTAHAHIACCVYNHNNEQWFLYDNLHEGVLDHVDESNVSNYINRMNDSDHVPNERIMLLMEVIEHTK